VDHTIDQLLHMHGYHDGSEQERLLLVFKELTRAKAELTTEQQVLLAELAGLENAIRNGSFLNAHFMAFKLAHDAWMEHIRKNAMLGARNAGSPLGAVLDGDR
jgi:hypothetical protein